MNIHEANIEARRLWGPFASAEHPKPGCWDANRGRCALYVKSVCVGNGPTWEDAFLNASKRLASRS